MADPVIDALQADGTLSVIHALQAERDRLQRQLDAAMAVVRAVAERSNQGCADIDGECQFCLHRIRDEGLVEDDHKPDCAWLAAIALVAAGEEHR